jgi:hypothetical protein
MAGGSYIRDKGREKGEGATSGNSGFRNQDSGFRIQDMRYGIRDTGAWMIAAISDVTVCSVETLAG